MTGVAVAICAALLLGVAASHVVLAQNQARLDELDKRARLAQADYARLRYEVAQLESPERVVAEAQRRLGMVSPADVKYVQSPPSPAGATVRTVDSPARTASPPAGDWRRVKAQLAAE